MADPSFRSKLVGPKNCCFKMINIASMCHSLFHHMSFLLGRKCLKRRKSYWMWISVQEQKSCAKVLVILWRHVNIIVNSSWKVLLGIFTYPLQFSVLNYQEIRRLAGKVEFSYEREVLTWSMTDFNFSYAVSSLDLVFFSLFYFFLFFYLYGTILCLPTDSKQVIQCGWSYYDH